MTTVYLGRPGRALLNAAWLLAEVVLIPTVLLYLFVAAGRPMLGLAVVFAWRTGCIAVRWIRGHRVPATVWVAFGIFAARTGFSLAASSVALYLWQPVFMTAAMGTVFILTAFTARPLIQRLAHDYVTLPPAVTSDRRVRATFRDLTLLWGGLHVACAGIAAWSMRFPVEATVAIHGAVGAGTTVAAVTGCVLWGVWRASRIPGLRLVRAAPPATV